MGACPSKPCPFKRGDKVKRLGNKPDYGKIGTVTDVKYTGEGVDRICSQVTVKYDDDTTESESASLFKLLSRESCLFKVGDKVRHKTDEYTGVVTEISFFNDLGEEQDKCQEATVERDDNRREEIVDVDMLEKVEDEDDDDESVYSALDRAEARRLGEEDEDEGSDAESEYGALDESDELENKCKKYVDPWLRGRKTVTINDIQTLRMTVPERRLSKEDLARCLQKRGVRFKQLDKPPLSPPPLPPNVCELYVRDWLGTKTSVTLDDIRTLRNTTAPLSLLSDDELENCLLGRNIQYPPRPWVEDPRPAKLRQQLLAPIQSPPIIPQRPQKPAPAPEDESPPLTTGAPPLIRPPPEDELPPAPAPGGRPPPPPEDDDELPPLAGDARAAAPTVTPPTSEKLEEIANKFVRYLDSKVTGAEWENLDKLKTKLKEIITLLGDPDMLDVTTKDTILAPGTKFVNIEIRKDNRIKWLSKPISVISAIVQQRGGAIEKYQFVIYKNAVATGGIRVKTYRKRKASKKRSKLTRKKHNG